MLGWHFTIEKKHCGEASGFVKLAVWQAAVSGLQWLDQLVKEEKAISLGGDGYPYKFKAQTKVLKPVVFSGPPYANAVWGFDHGDILLPGWQGKTCIDRDAWEACDPDEWLDIVVYDES
jgi:hypothetical protein